MRTTKGRRGLETALALSGQAPEEESPGYRVPPPVAVAKVGFLDPSRQFWWEKGNHWRQPIPSKVAPDD